MGCQGHYLVCTLVFKARMQKLNIQTPASKNKEILEQIVQCNENSGVKLINYYHLDFISWCVRYIVTNVNPTYN